MRNFAKLRFLSVCLVVFLLTSIVSAETKEDDIIKKNNKIINKITQSGTFSVEIEKIDRSKLAANFNNFKTFGEEKQLKEQEKLSIANNKRLKYYKPRLDAYVPPVEEISILVTGYSSTPDQTWGDPFTTASGTRVHLGTMACPPQYPFGTKISIEGRGRYICEDRGGAIKGNHFDMWFESRGEALHWGKRVVVAKIEK